MLRFLPPVVIALASILSIVPRAPWAGQAGSGLLSGTPVESSRLWDSSDFVHVVSTERSSGEEDEFAVTLRIDDGCHINANPASLPYLIPTSLARVGITPLRTSCPVASRLMPTSACRSLAGFRGR